MSASSTEDEHETTGNPRSYVNGAAEEKAFKRRVMTCSHCGVRGHNKKGCPMREQTSEDLLNLPDGDDRAGAFSNSADLPHNGDAVASALGFPSICTLGSSSTNDDDKSVSRRAPGEALTEADGVLEAESEIKAQQAASMRLSVKTWESQAERRMTGQHFPAACSYQARDAPSAGSRVVYVDPRGRCKMCGKKSRYRCQQCNVFLHIKNTLDDFDCWACFHGCEKFSDQPPAPVLPIMMPVRDW